MTVSERIFEIMRKRGMTQKEFSEETNIGQSTISDWKHKGTNPSADKILPICRALGVTPEELLSGQEHYSLKDRERDYYIVNKNSEPGQLLTGYWSLEQETRQRLIGYVEALRAMQMEEKRD